MIYRLAADLLLIVHLAFVGFVLFGAVLVARWRKLMPWHIAAVLWGVLTEFIGVVCPLTPLEVNLRQLSGEAGYRGDFIEHYIVSALYPSGLTRALQIWLGFIALLPNVIVYGYFFARRRRRESRPAH